MKLGINKHKRAGEKEYFQENKGREEVSKGSK